MRVLEVERCAGGVCPAHRMHILVDLFYCSITKNDIKVSYKTFPKGCPLKKVQK